MLAPPLSSVQLARLREREEARMVDTCNIVSRTRVSDNAGGNTYTETTTEDVPCWRQPGMAGEAESLFGGQLLSGLQWLYVFPYGTAISADDEIIYGTERFEVMGVLGPRTLELARRVIAVEKTTG
jgi:hypothetical protein